MNLQVHFLSTSVTSWLFLGAIFSHFFTFQRGTRGFQNKIRLEQLITKDVVTQKEVCLHPTSSLDAVTEQTLDNHEYWSAYILASLTNT